MEILQLPDGSWGTTILEQDRHRLRFGPPGTLPAAPGRGAALAVAVAFLACAGAALAVVPERILSSTLAGIFLAGAILAAAKALRRPADHPRITVDFDALKIRSEGARRGVWMVGDATVWVHPQEFPKTATIHETIYMRRLWWVSLLINEDSPLGPTVIHLIGLGFRKDMEFAGKWLAELGGWKGLIIE